MKTKERIEISSFLLFIGIIILISILYVKQKADFIQKGYKIEVLRKKIEELQNFNNCLKIEMGTLYSPTRITEIAKFKLGLVFSTSEDMISLENKKR